MKHLLTIILCLCLAILVFGCRKKNTGVLTGRAAKDFRLETIDHQRFYLNQNKQKVVVLVFWETTCTVCKKQMVDFKSLSDSSGAGDIIIAAVCSDPENIDDVKKIIGDLGINYPVLLDKDARVTKQYAVANFPTTVVIDKDQIISLAREGYSPAILKQIKDSAIALVADKEDK